MKPRAHLDRLRSLLRIGDGCERALQRDALQVSFDCQSSTIPISIAIAQTLAPLPEPPALGSREKVGVTYGVDISKVTRRASLN